MTATTTNPSTDTSTGTATRTDPTAADPAARGPALTALGLFTILLGTSLPSTDFFVVNVALPDIARDLGASPSALEMVAAGYAVAYAVLLVLGGRLGDAYGRRRLFLWGVAGFGLTSLACGLAPGAWSLVGFRAAQGVASALMLPQVLATIHATTRGERRARAVALYGAVSGLAMVLGQVLGGVLVSADIGGTGWRMAFLINVPVVVLALPLAVRSVPDSRAEQPRSGDVGGTVLLAAALVALLLPLTEGRAAGWPLWSVLTLLAAPLLLWAFAAVERRAEDSGGSPLLPPSLLREPGVARGLLIGVPIFIGFSGFMFVGAVTLQEGLGYGALKAGLTLVPMGLAQFCGSLLLPRLVNRLGSRTLTLCALVHGAGLVVLAATLLWAPWSALSPPALAPGLVLCGLGQGLQLPLYYRLLLAAVPAARAGAGSGLAATAQQSGLAVGVATLGSLFLALETDLGTREAFAAVLAVQLAGLLGLAALSLRLPRELG
ncbi:MFS transporter [Streptomyces longispororuber]|uniref:MFS transporter n=1 Tax=Streptomyces longispororuber TaxID=68230 RepID=A0A919A584_9ACTN|nr:MFS transporter [Streptomyces longispororuber]GHE84576.1 MFS transporter [Streptomyces longispororuber]